MYQLKCFDGRQIMVIPVTYKFPSNIVIGCDKV